ncbi:PGF-CTERM sorting domain-containing protein [Halorubellus sp. PRR65]|uniref:PGF-CTERM sorting domain-containing protein n=1 Tax=Halorubellus sp. PRR65 TaxID=3098148 RepID=UPI002B25E991|nr:PGF-CTERM sorting domain-containing protein [Halorubellus sp. PRR65]
MSHFGVDTVFSITDNHSHRDFRLAAVPPLGTATAVDVTTDDSTPNETTDVTTTGSADDANGMPGFGLAAAVTALAAVALLARTRH